MQLASFMSERSLSDEELARMLGCSAHAVNKWRRGKRFPRQRQMARIREATGGLVTPDDFMPSISSADGVA
jgi:transcriptional regulator with XRE-family HTH domain